MTAALPQLPRFHGTAAPRGGPLGASPASALLLVASLLGLAACSGGGSSLSGRGENMNVLLIVVDTLRADHLPSYGYERDTAPSVTRLAERGVVFENAFVNCNFSGGSFASLLTGMYPHHHGIRDHPMTMADEVETLAEMFRNSGYRTFGRHTQFLLLDRWNYDQGYDDYKFAWEASATTADAVRFLDEAGDGAGDQPFFLFIQYMLPHHPY